MNEVKWDVVRTSEDEIIGIDDDYQGELFCVECNSLMIPVRGDLRQHHFRHDVECNCSGESAQHWSKKFEIFQILSDIGEAEMEGRVGRYLADVLFEKVWAFEVVFSNPPSEEKMNDLDDRLVIFNFDSDVFSGPQFDDMFEGRSFEQVVLDLGQSILDGGHPEVCNICREVKGWLSRFKEGGRCVHCDMQWYAEQQKREERASRFAKDYARAKMR